LPVIWPFQEDFNQNTTLHIIFTISCGLYASKGSMIATACTLSSPVWMYFQFGQVKFQANSHHWYAAKLELMIALQMNSNCSLQTTYLNLKTFVW